MDLQPQPRKNITVETLDFGRVKISDDGKIRHVATDFGANPEFSTFTIYKNGEQ